MPLLELLWPEALWPEVPRLGLLRLDALWPVVGPFEEKVHCRDEEEGSFCWMEFVPS